MSATVCNCVIYATIVNVGTLQGGRVGQDLVYYEVLTKLFLLNVVVLPVESNIIQQRLYCNH